MQLERLITVARQLLTIALPDSPPETWVWEHSERVAALAEKLGAAPEVGSHSLDGLALSAAAYFHDAGWVVEFHQGRWQPWQLLTRPTNEIQRELGAAELQREAGSLLPPAAVNHAVEIIRHCNKRQTKLVEAVLLAEAEALDDLSTLYVLRQYRQYRGEGRPLRQIAETWRRQKEYGYWELRVQENLRWETTRRLARQRLTSVEQYMNALARDLRGDDVVLPPRADQSDAGANPPART